MAGRSKKFNKRSAIFIIAVIAILAIAAVIVYFVAPDIFGKPAPSPGGEGTIETPGDDTETPGDDTETPGGDTETPGDDTETPGGDTETPGGDTETPGGDTEIPGDDGPPLVAGEGELQVHFMDVGQGDSILILFPDGKDMLIDCGNKSSGYDFDVTAGYLEDYLPDGKLDYLMLTHGDEDHVEYMDEILEMYQVSTVFMPNVLAEPSGTSAAAKELREQIAALDPEKLAMFDDEDTLTTQVYARFFIAALSEPDCEVILTVDPDEDTNSIVITDGTKQADGSYAGATYMLTFYCPTEEYYASSDLSSAEEKNAISPIGILEYNGVRVVLTGDSNEINEPLFVERAGYIDCDVLKVGHHGSETSSTEGFLDAVDCEYAIISCNAEGNTFYHPRQNTLDRLIEDGMTIYRTDNNGNILLTVDESGEITFTTEREADRTVNGDGWTDEEINEAKKK